MDDIHERSQLGYRILHLSKDPGVSDFYITPWEQLTYKRLSARSKCLQAALTTLFPWAHDATV